MKFIAPSDFSQGLRNPLKLPGGGMHVPKGTIFSIGGDDIPYDRAGRGLTGQDLETFRALYHLLVPLDSDQGRQILAECERAKKSAEDIKRAESARNRPHKYWYEKPAGLIAIGVVVGVAVFVLCEYLAHKFPGFFHSQKP
jgi:hypothetical protein